MRSDEEPIVVEQKFNRPPQIVWEAITELDQMRQWYFEEIESFKPEVGFETRFSYTSEERDFLHIWKVTEVDPLKKIVYNWKFEGYPGDGFVVFELSGDENATTLTVTNVVTESFPDDIPEFKRESGVEGWKYLIQDCLKAYLK